MLSDKDISQFARFVVEHCVPGLHEIAPSRRDKLLKEARLSALSYYETALDDIRGSGWRVTKRVKRIVLRTLCAIRDRQIAPTVLSRYAVVQIAMTCGGEKTHPVVIMDGNKMRWVGFGWVDEGEATIADREAYPLVVDDA